MGHVLVSEGVLSIYGDAAVALGVRPQEVRAVFSVEAAGRFYGDDGLPVIRFEPHHIERRYWGEIGFKVRKGLRPWRASLKLRKRAREAMRGRAEAVVGREAMLLACSMGAPQIMGFNHGLCGYDSAADMYAEFSGSKAAQVMAFAAFVDASGLASKLRAHDWRGFASGYNGPANVDDYAPKLERAWRREAAAFDDSLSFGSGEVLVASPKVLSLGSSGAAVEELQRVLAEVTDNGMVVDGYFGDETKRAVVRYQRENTLKPDGVVGFQTWSSLAGASTASRKVRPVAQESVSEADNVERLKSGAIALGSAALGGGGVGGALDGLDGGAQTVLMIGVVVVASVVAVVWAAPYIRRIIGRKVAT